jgi:hypothetical protein
MRILPAVLEVVTARIAVAAVAADLKLRTMNTTSLTIGEAAGARLAMSKPSEETKVLPTLTYRGTGIS